MGNGFDKHKNDSMEASIKEAGDKIMKEAAERKAKEEAIKPKEIGSWKINLMSSTEFAEVDVENFKEKLMQFEMQCNADFPMLRVHIDKAEEDGV